MTSTRSDCAHCETFGEVWRYILLSKLGEGCYQHVAVEPREAAHCPTTQPHNKESPGPTCTPSCIWRSYDFLIELCQHGKHGNSHTRLLGRSFQENWEQGWVRRVDGGDFDKPSIMILSIFLCLYQKRESATFKLRPVYSPSLDSASESLTLQLYWNHTLHRWKKKIHPT